MKAKYAKTYINRLVKKYKTKRATATALGVDTGYIYLLQKNKRKASPSLIKLMKLLLEKG